MADNKNRFNAIISDETQLQLIKLARKTNGNRTEAIRRSIAVMTMIEDAASKGGIVQIQLRNGTIQEIVFI